MTQHLASKLLDDYDHGKLSRREVAARILGMGAAMATTVSAAAAESDPTPSSTFDAMGLDHIALDVTDVARSRAFYEKHLGLKVLRDGGDQRCFLGPPEGEFILALFRSDKPGMNHYCFAITDYAPDDVAAKLRGAGIEPRREGDRVYFPDPDGITVQLAGRS